MLHRAMSADPFHPMGFGCFGDAPRHSFAPRGSRISFGELPEPCRRLVVDDYAEIWKDAERERRATA